MQDDIETTELTASQFDDPTIVFTVECGFCSTEYNDDIDMMSDDTVQEQMAQKLKDAGWKNRTSEKFAAECLCCPDCLELDDEDLGE